MSFDPGLCRNESEVESKLIVQYLLPKLGYTPDTWHQEVTFGSIRLDFLAFATQVLPFALDADTPLSVVMEAKHPQQKLDSHIRRLKRYLTSLSVRYGLLTNGKEIRIYERVRDDVQLIFQCSGNEVEDRLDEIKALVGRDSLKENSDEIPLIDKNAQNDLVISQSASDVIFEKKRQYQVKIIAVYHNKGGVGKTTTVVKLAAALRKKGKRVLIVDLDSQANTTFAVGLAKFTDEEDDNLKDSNIYHVISSRAKYPITEVARKTQFTNPEVDAIPAHISLMEYERKLIEIEPAKKRLYDKLKQVEDDYDIVLIDTPPSLNLYARIALITADYLIIPSDLKPFANEGLANVRNFIEDIDEFRGMLGKLPLNVIGVLPSKISTNSKFRQHTLPNRENTIRERYNFPIMKSRIFEREDLAKSLENSVTVGNIEIPDPRSVMDYKPDSLSATEFEYLASEVMNKIGMKS